MCQKYILEACKQVAHTPVKEQGKVLVQQSRYGEWWHKKYLGDAAWDITTRKDTNGNTRTECVIHDYHNIEKAILYLQHSQERDMPSLCIEVKELLDNEEVPDSLIHGRYRGMRKHGYLNDDSSLGKKGYEALMMLRDPTVGCRNVPTKLREAIKALGSDLLQECDI